MRVDLQMFGICFVMKNDVVELRDGRTFGSEYFYSKRY